jgi:hypothetical protein
MKRLITAFALILALAVFVLPAGAQANRSWFFAYDFGQWSIPGQQPNVYTVQGANACTQQAQGVNFFPFNTNAPVLIFDTGSSTANNEVVTPTTVVNQSAQCGITASPSHSHYSFQLKSGTAGLQEAVNSVLNSGSYPNTVFLDVRWWGLAANVPGTTPAAIIAAVAGSTSVQLVDTSQAPFQSYIWNGANYVKSSLGGTSFYGLKPSSLTVISAPSALNNATTYTNSATGGTIAAGAYRGCITYVDAIGGESLCSTDSAAQEVTTTTGSTSKILVTAPAAATGAVGWRLYISADSGGAGTEVFYNPTAAGCTQSSKTWRQACSMASNAIVTALVTTTAKVPSVSTAHPTAITVSSRPLEVFQTEFGPFPDTSTQTAASTYIAAEFQAPASLFNTLSKHVRVCGQIEATAVNTAVPTYSLTVATARGQSANTLVTFTPGALTGAAYSTNFCIDIKTSVTGASGIAEVHGTSVTGLASSGVPATGGVVTDKNTSTVTFGDLTQNTLYFQLASAPTTAGFSAYVVRDLSIQVLN